VTADLIAQMWELIADGEAHARIYQAVTLAHLTELAVRLDAAEEFGLASIELAAPFSDDSRMVAAHRRYTTAQRRFVDLCTPQEEDRA
jgi:hypothetical protein